MHIPTLHTQCGGGGWGGWGGDMDMWIYTIYICIYTYIYICICIFCHCPTPTRTDSMTLCLPKLAREIRTLSCPFGARTIWEGGECCYGVLVVAFCSLYNCLLSVVFVCVFEFSVYLCVVLLLPVVATVVIDVVVFVIDRIIVA